MALLLGITGTVLLVFIIPISFTGLLAGRRLLGAEVTLVGIRPEVAQTMVGIEIDLQDVRTYSDLQSAPIQVRG